MPPAARVGDMHMCPMQTMVGPVPVPHVGGPISGPGIPVVLIGGMPAAVMGDMCVCVGPNSDSGKHRRRALVPGDIILFQGR